MTDQTSDNLQVPDSLLSGGVEANILAGLEESCAEEVKCLKEMRKNRSPDLVRAQIATRVIQGIRVQADLLKQRMDLSNKTTALSTAQQREILGVILDSVKEACTAAKVSTRVYEQILTSMSANSKTIEQQLARAVSEKVDV